MYPYKTAYVATLYIHYVCMYVCNTFTPHMKASNYATYGTAQRQLDTHGLSRRISVDFYMCLCVHMLAVTPVKGYCYRQSSGFFPPSTDLELGMYLIMHIHSSSNIYTVQCNTPSL